MPSAPSSQTAPPETANPHSNVPTTTVERLRLENIVVGYSRDKPVIRDVSLRLYAGELLVILGPNGCGKSTLLRAAAGTLSLRSGRVLLDGADSSQLTRREMAQRVAVVPQDVSVTFGFSVKQVVAMGRAPFQGKLQQLSQQDRHIVERALEQTGIASLASRQVQHLSGGEQKRVAIARALAQQPQVLLLDEATAHLDIRHVLDWYALLRRLVTEESLACLSIVHDLNEAARYADRVALMRTGKLLSCGDVSSTMTPARLHQTFDVDLAVGNSPVDGAPLFVPA